MKWLRQWLELPEPPGHLQNVLFLIVPPAPPHHLRRLSQANSALLTSHTTLSPPPTTTNPQRTACSARLAFSLPRSRLVSSSRDPRVVPFHCLSAVWAPSLEPSSPLFFFFPALMVPHCMGVPCRVHASAPPYNPHPTSSHVSPLYFPPFQGNQLILCVSKPLCLCSFFLCFRFIQLGD